MVDTNAQISAVARGIRTVDLDGHPTRVQTLTQVYSSTLDDVWDATTSNERIARWFLPVEGELRLGGRYQLVGNAGGTIEKCSPPEGGVAHYRATWEYGGGVSWIEIGLRALSEERTELTLTHLGRTEDVPEEFWEQFGPGATGVGWDQGLLGLALHLGEGPAITPDKAEEWMLSEEGTAFARAAADAWANAQIADGSDPARARKAADATFAFYTTPPAS